MNCFTFSSGWWKKSHSLMYSRYKHISWESESGIILFGSADGDGRDTTELLLPNGSTEEKFKLKYGRLE